METHTGLRSARNGQHDYGPQATTHTLANGLQVVLLEDHNAPVVALQAWVHFGSADEEPAVAGIAHVFEHMLFKGTERFPHGEIAALIEGAGGSVNAWTSYDETVYHVTIASRFWETGFDVLSDAVLYSLFDPTELDKEKEVVLEELRRGKDSPDRETSERLFELAYTTHPYRRPIIGWEETVTPISRQDMLRVFNTWYAPNNMIFVAVGDFDSPTLLAAIEARFGTIAARPLPLRPRHEEPIQTAPRVAVFPFQAELARVEIAFPGIAARDPHTPALDVLSDLLGAGYNSVLYTELKRRHDVAHDVYAYNYTPFDRGLFLLGASCTPDNAADIVRRLMQQACTPNLSLTETELETAKTRIISHFVHARETYQGIADQLGRCALAYGDANYGTHYITAIDTLCLEDIRQAAATFLSPQRANIALLMPSEAPLPDSSAVLAWAEEDRQRPFSMPHTTRREHARVTVLTLPGNSRLVVQTDRKAPLVSIRTVCDGGQRYEPAGKEGLARLLTTVWDRGTVLRSAAEIERDVDRLGALLSVSSDRDTVQISARFLKDTFAEGLGLYFDVLTEPTFPESEVARERADQLRELDTLKENRFHFAFQHFLQAFYGAHPYSHVGLGMRDAVAGITRDDLLALHSTLLHPARMVFSVVGDITVDDVLEHFQRSAPPALFAAEPGNVPLLPSPLCGARCSNAASSSTANRLTLCGVFLPSTCVTRTAMLCVSSIRFWEVWAADCLPNSETRRAWPMR